MISKSKGIPSND